MKLAVQQQGDPQGEHAEAQREDEDGGERDAPADREAVERVHFSE